MATTKRKKKTVKKAPTAVSLKREVTILTTEVERLTDLARSRRLKFESRDETITELQEELNNVIDVRQRLEVENAELHGYINRVELEDDTAWYKEHRAGMLNSDGTESTIPPLRQRLRGSRSRTRYA